jgi:DNA-binding PadR family transcriptional regulator
LSTDLTTFSFIVLALVGKEGAGAHDLVTMARYDPLYWAGADSQYYAEPKRLARLGYLEPHREPGKTRERTRYSLTEVGRAALEEWLGRPSSFPRIYHEAAVRVMAGDLVDPAVTIAGLQPLKAELLEIGLRVDAALDRAGTIPHRARHLELNHRLARRIVDAHLEWIADLERELGG